MAMAYFDSAADRLRAAQPILEKWAEELAHILGRGDIGGALRITLIKHNTASDSFRLQTGRHTGFLKLFNKSEEGVEGYRRERMALVALKGSGVAPRHLAHCDADGFVLSEFIGGRTLSEVISSNNALAWTRRLGVWLAKMDAKAPAEPCRGNWAEYLGRYRGLAPLGDIAGAEDALYEIPLCGMALARCDASFTNLMVPDMVTLKGVDYERAEMKPRGWDFVLAYQALIARFPEHGEALLEALADGFASQHRGALIADELSYLARIVLCARLEHKQAA